MNQKIEMKRHLEKRKKCIINDNINNLSEDELYNLSLKKHINIINTYNKENLNENYDSTDNFKNNNDINDNNNDINDNNNDINDNNNNEINNNEINKLINDMNHNYCEKCDKFFYNKSNLNKHFKKNICDKNSKKNNIQNIGVQNNIINNNQKIINININYIKGFDEDWDVSKIDDIKKGEILLSNSKFSKTLENILKNDVNLNVILNNDDDNDVGVVYKNKKNRYEPMKNKDIIEMSMEKIYKHLKDFYKEITKNNINDLSESALKNELIELEKKYSRFFNLEDAQDIVRKSFTHIYDTHKKDAEKKFYELLDEGKKESY
jgi:merozoite surface protein 8